MECVSMFVSHWQGTATPATMQHKLSLSNQGKQLHENTQSVDAQLKDSRLTPATPAVAAAEPVVVNQRPVYTSNRVKTEPGSEAHVKGFQMTPATAGPASSLLAVTPKPAVPSKGIKTEQGCEAQVLGLVLTPATPAAPASASASTEANHTPAHRSTVIKKEQVVDAHLMGPLHTPAAPAMKACTLSLPNQEPGCPSKEVKTEQAGGDQVKGLEQTPATLAAALSKAAVAVSSPVFINLIDSD